jgi:5-methylcytosine-specific restriction enzyme subunit McrC
MPIPIRNLYYLFCYAWERFPEGGAVEVGVDDCPDLPNLFARLLVNSAHRLMRRGLDRGYRGLIEETRAPRGRMLLDEIVKGQTLRRGALVCSFDELTSDVLHNRIIKATAATLARAGDVEPGLAHELRLIVKRLAEVRDIRLEAGCFSRVQLSRNTGQYVVALRLCEMIHRHLLPEETGDQSRFASILTDEVRMNEIFEQFLRNFYRREQQEFGQVGAEMMAWEGESYDPGGWAHLPAMVTDITLRSPQRTVVIDAKFYKDTFSRRHETPKIHSTHLYQLMTYLQHAGRRTPDLPVEGILIYPATGEAVRLRYRLKGFDIQVAAIDLAQPWQDIHRDLISILASSSQPAPLVEHAA